MNSLRPCDCGAEPTGRWADVHEAGCAALRTGPLRPDEVEAALDQAFAMIDAEFPGDAPRMVVNSVDRGEGVYFWEIKSPYRPAVEAEVMRLQQADGVVHSEFYRPWREGPWWRATGFTRVAAASARTPGARVTRADVAAATPQAAE